MGKTLKCIIVALVISIIFLLFAVQPGIFSMIGYAISLLIFPENSPEHLKYGNLILYLFDIFCGVIVFWIVYKMMNTRLR